MEQIATPTRQFTLLEITSGLPDDSREADERAVARHLKDLRGRVKAARAAISATPGAEEVLRRDWMRSAGFYARFGITEAQFRRGALPVEDHESVIVASRWPADLRQQADHGQGRADEGDCESHEGEPSVRPSHCVGVRVR